MGTEGLHDPFPSHILELSSQAPGSSERGLAGIPRSPSTTVCTLFEGRDWFVSLILWRNRNVSKCTARNSLSLWFSPLCYLIRLSARLDKLVVKLPTPKLQQHLDYKLFKAGIIPEGTAEGG